MGADVPPSSPWLYIALDNAGNMLRATVVFTPTSPFPLTSVTMFRDAACLYRNIYFGLGANGAPDSTVRQFTVSAGTTVVPAGTLSTFGFVNFTDVIAGQITAGP